MAILGNILGNLLGKADKIVDEVITSQEERMQLKNELQKIIQEQEALIEQEVTKRSFCIIANSIFVAIVFI